jgi:signal transduction histidine kinase
MRAAFRTIANVTAGIILRKQSELARNEIQAQLVQSNKMGALGQLAAGVAHELNNPLAIIMGNAQYLLQAPVYAEALQGILREIEGAAQKCKGIIADLLSFSRKKELQWSEGMINDVMARVLNLVRFQIELNNVAIETHFEKNLPPLRMSISHIEQVLLNLVVNAVQAMPQGGKLTITTRRSEACAAAEIVIEDTGAGIPAENLPRLFDPFFTTKKGGTGLGLSVSYGIIRQHGGELAAASAGPGAGSAFTVTLPCSGA